MTDAPERCPAKAEAPRTDDAGNVLRTEAGETYTVPVECDLPTGHAGEHRTKLDDGEPYSWSD
jgi:hypothetical protein